MCFTSFLMTQIPNQFFDKLIPFLITEPVAGVVYLISYTGLAQNVCRDESQGFQKS